MRDFDFASWGNKWGSPLYGKHERQEKIPALDAVGYRWTPEFGYPVAVPLAQPVEKADFTKGPQMSWWMKKEKSHKPWGAARGIKRVLRSINNLF